MDTMTLLADEAHLLKLVATRFRQAAVHQDKDLAAWSQVNTHLQRIQPSQQTMLTATTLPVCQYLAQTLAAPGADTALGLTLRPLLPRLAWIQNPNYQADAMPINFLENYGYADFVSQRGLIADEAFALGILLLGPHTKYPPHVHPAEEIYYAIGGACQWWQTGQSWIARSTKSFVYHPSGIAHAIRTGQEPVCLLYAWWGAVQTAAQLTPMTTA